MKIPEISPKPVTYRVGGLTYKVKKVRASFPLMSGEGKANALIYGHFVHKTEMEGNYHIVDLGRRNDGRYMLHIENSSYLDNDLPKLEQILCEWIDEANGFCPEDLCD